MKEIKLTRGMVALVDDEDFEWLNEFRWHVVHDGNCFYASNRAKGRMHRLIMNTPSELVCDHINHDTLNNQKYNLRNVTKSQNCMNRMVYKTSKTGHKGVSQRGKKFISYIKTQGRQIYLGSFDTIEKASNKYNEVAADIFGEYSFLNRGKDGN